ncbi:MAG: protease inhibitor I42 family protein [Bacteroidales bacterium]|nr:protease inhibitor I42 family protein [Bacteroidales bacterium]
MRKKHLNRFLLLLLVPILFSCNSAPLTMVDNGSAIDIAKGETFDLVLESTKKSEKVWELREMDTSVVSLVNGPIFNTKKHLDSEIMEYLYTFKGERPGTTTIHLVLHDPENPDKPAKKDFRLTVKVTE